MDTGLLDTASTLAPGALPSWRFPLYRPADMKYLAVVLKIAERCNIDCSYCHVFNGNDSSWRHHPKAMAVDTVRDVGRFLQQGIADLRFPSVRIVFQGGEPMMMRKRDFAQTCEILRSSLSGASTVEFVMQTNGTLVDDDWIGLLSRYKVSAGISLDGLKSAHDLRRVDHRKRGTYDRVIVGLRALQEAARAGLVDMPVTLTVIDPHSDARATYRHLVDDLQLRCINFLLPKNCHDNVAGIDVRAYGSWLATLFDEWTTDDDVEIDVRLFRDILDMFLHDRAGLWWGRNDLREWEFAICIASDGGLGPDDEYRATDFWLDVAGHNVRTTSLADFLDSKAFHVLNRAKRTVPADCRPCMWQRICGGGALLNRYSRENGFNNRSVLCNSLQDFYMAVLRYLLSSGVRLERLSKALVVPASN
jgi:uncharacterized protein